ncbi:TetR/AcrR family transcriptional regulator [Sulfitobacter sp. MOLA879]|uniref:TetR/AcrR family transcriptional regulator n=1 Tax=Sulfitobacter sp. MOLA879 TaxID=3368579 RepID=UPI003746B951
MDDSELLDGIEALFLAHGFRALTMAQIAQKLSCSYRRIYQLADNKSALFSLIVSRFLAKILHEAEAGVAKGGSI